MYNDLVWSTGLILSKLTGTQIYFIVTHETDWGALLSQNTNTEISIPKIVHLRVKDPSELNNLSILYKKKGISASK